MALHIYGKKNFCHIGVVIMEKKRGGVAHLWQTELLSLVVANVLHIYDWRCCIFMVALRNYVEKGRCNIARITVQETHHCCGV